MKSISSLFRSLYQLTKVAAFKSIADSIQKMDTTKSQVDKVAKDAKAVKDSMNKK